MRVSRKKKLPRAFYLRPTLKVAKELIGKLLMRQIGDHRLAGRIVEVEAYLGEKDPASHAFRGKTKRNEVMFQNGGHLYVYFTYGMHFCSNVVTEEEGIGHAVLLRAVEPLEGLAIMARNRGLPFVTEREKQNLCSGPAKLCEAFGIAREENGTDLCGDNIGIEEEPSPATKHKVHRSTRIGITQGKEHNWRFFLRNSPFISRGKPVLT